MSCSYVAYAICEEEHEMLFNYVVYGWGISTPFKPVPVPIPDITSIHSHQGQITNNEEREDICFSTP
jgi:hypothetical protein